MKCIVIGDIFIDEEIMERALIERYGDNCCIKKFHFGTNDRQQMRTIVKKIEEFEKVPLPDGIFSEIHDVDIIMTHLCPVTESMIDNAKKLKYILSNRGGVENIAVDYAKSKNIKVINNPEHNADAVAEYTIGLILNEIRNISRSDFSLRKNIWRENYPNSQNIKELRDLTIGIIGFGTIGNLVVEKLVALNCNVLIYDYNNISKFNDKYSFCNLEELLKSSDVVTLHARSNEVILNKKALSYLNNDAYIINTARSNLIDNSALYDILKHKKIKGAALDVFDVEPLELDNKFLELDNITLTNHRAGDTLDSYIKSPSELLMKL